MTAGVTRLGPSQLIPPHGGRNVAAAKRMRYEPGDRPLMVNRPVGPLVSRPTTLPFDATASTWAPGRPRSRSSTTPLVPPPPGAKSSQTVPEMASEAATPGGRAGNAGFGTPPGGMATSAAGTDWPGVNVCVDWYPPAKGANSSGRDGRAPGYAPGGSNTLRTELTAALAKPLCGS